MTLDEKISRFRKDVLGSFEPPQLLAGDASNRVYYRVRAGAGSYIVCYDVKLPGDEAYPFINVHAIMKSAGVPVPQIFNVDAEAGLILQEDLGDGLVEFIFDGLERPQKKALYERIVDIMLDIQSIRGRGGPFDLRFDPEKLMYEFDFFIKHALCGYFGRRADDGRMAALRREFEKICGILDRPELSVLNHRDYHSRNVIVKLGKPYVIDFQDARLGLPQYDLVSLIRDSYLVLDESMFQELKEYYHASAAKRGILAMPSRDFDHFFDIQAFQRNVKAVGTFGYQVSALGNMKFEKYIQPTLQYLDGYCARRAELGIAGEIIKSLTIRP